MHWKKLGVLIAPQLDIAWMSHYTGPSFARQTKAGISLFMTGRDANNVSRIGTVPLEIDGERARLGPPSQTPVFDVGAAGTFDENGVSYPWLYETGGKIFMYYVGWVAGGKTRFQNFTGLAISKDGGRSFRRARPTPILDRTTDEPYGSGSCSVYKEGRIWKMIYTAFGPWDMGYDVPRPHYKLKSAHSKNGIDWVRDGQVVVDYASAEEYVIGKPMLLKEKGLYRLWYSYRGDRYRIGYAESRDGRRYIRKDDEVGLDVSSSGWDSEMVEYAYVFDYADRRYMLYNGNDFGKTGLGWAILEK